MKILLESQVARRHYKRLLCGLRQCLHPEGFDNGRAVFSDTARFMSEALQIIALLKAASGSRMTCLALV